MAGWIKAHRAMQKHWIFSDAEKLRAWMIILFVVNFEPKKVVIKNSMYICGRGESLLSLDSWAREFGGKWNKSAVRRFFTLLQNDSMIVLKSEQKTTRLTVCNYESYQDEGNADETHMKRKRNADETQMTPTKEGKEGKEGKELYTSTAPDGPEDSEEYFITSKRKKLKGKRLETFKIFWDKFNYKSGRAEAAQAWMDIEELRPSVVNVIYAAAEEEAKNRPQLRADKKTPKMGQGWLTARRWEDEITPAASAKEPGSNISKTVQSGKDALEIIKNIEIDLS